MTEVRLVDGDHRCSGKPEVLRDGEWMRVSSTYVYFQQAAMLCRELDCGNIVSVTLQSDFRASNEDEYVVYMLCHGQSNFSQCPSLVGGEHSRFRVGLVCSGN